MKLEDLGFTQDLESFRANNIPEEFSVARVISEHRERYVIKTADAEYEAEVMGNLRFTATSRADFPTVGDWVAFAEYDSGKGLIHAIFPRNSLIQRAAVGKKGEKQIIGANIDVAFILQAVDRDFNLNRLERYLTICYDAGIAPTIILSKTDLMEQSKLNERIQQIERRVEGVPVYAISNLSGNGIEALKKHIEKGKTYCLLGSSGAGKSSLINSLSGENAMETRTISGSTGKGTHTTTHRELIQLENGGLLMDNPGMRELGTADSIKGLETTFDSILSLSEECRFNDCTHTSETGCAVLEAVDAGELDPMLLENYQRMKREQEHFGSTVAERREKDKAFGKMVKQVVQAKNKKLLLLLLLLLPTVFGCRVNREIPSKLAVEEAIKSPAILFVTCMVKVDTLSDTYTMELTDKIIVEGRLKDFTPVAYQAGYLNCTLLDGNDEIVLETAVPDPTRKHLEFVDDTGMLNSREIVLDSASLSLRIPMEPTVQKLLFAKERTPLLQIHLNSD